MSRYDYDPPLCPPLWSEQDEIDFIDWVVLPLCLLLVIPVLILALCLNVWEWARESDSRLMQTINPKEMSDDDLAALAAGLDSLSAESNAREFAEEAGDQLMATLRSMSDQARDDLDEDVVEEINRRQEAKDRAAAAHAIEQGEAREADNKPAGRKPEETLAYRAAWLMRLANLNAPEIVLFNAIKMVAKFPGYSEWAETEGK